MQDYDVDWVVVGSGFGGSVSALRLAEKGYSVTVLEQGRRFEDHELPKSSWDLKKYFFAPAVGLKGIFKLTPFKDVFVMSGAGVGGGSLVYAMTLYVPPGDFFDDPQWAGLGDWRRELAPHYETAQRMLGVTDVVAHDKSDQLLLEYGRELGVESTYRKARVGTFLGAPGETVPDPYFGGEGPARTGCTSCARCMLGCPVGSKNSLPKNYLWFAERRGAKIEAERQVVSIRPLGAADGSDGYEIVHERTGGRLRRQRRTIRARGVVVAGGALGTNQLLATAKLNGDLPRLSDRLGHLVRTNSEAVLGVTVPPSEADGLIDRVAITSSIYPDPRTHIETVVYGKGGGALRGLFTMLTGDGTRVTRPLRLVGQMLRHPRKVAELYLSKGWSERTITILVMQSLDNALTLTSKLKRNGRAKLQTEQDPLHPNPTFIPIANQFAEWLAKRTGGVAASSVLESMFSIPTTAHFLGGAPIGADASTGVVDADQHVFGYENLLVCDGAAVPANVGVNPSLTITAMSERAMSKIPVASGGTAHEPVGMTDHPGKTAVAVPEHLAILSLSADQPDA